MIRGGETEERLSGGGEREEGGEKGRELRPSVVMVVVEMGL